LDIGAGVRILLHNPPGIFAPTANEGRISLSRVFAGMGKTPVQFGPTAMLVFGTASAPGGLAPPERKFSFRGVRQKRKYCACEARGTPPRLTLAPDHALFVFRVCLFSPNFRSGGVNAVWSAVLQRRFVAGGLQSAGSFARDEPAE